MSQDCTKGKIYKITNDFNDDVYIGSTCGTLVKRFNRHKLESRIEQNKHRPLYKLINEIGFDRFRIELVEDYPCEDKYQLRQREGHYIREIGTMNIKIEDRKRKEYREDNKEKIKIYMVKYDEMRKEKKNIYDREQYLKHRETRLKKANDNYLQKKLNQLNIIEN